MLQLLIFSDAIEKVVMHNRYLAKVFLHSWGKETHVKVKGFFLSLSPFPFPLFPFPDKCQEA
ncbi:hypothetical protein NSTC731_06645 [Nostoc sp. DSM 114167]|jgi:hypothetical protein